MTGASDCILEPDTPQIGHSVSICNLQLNLDKRKKNKIRKHNKRRESSPLEEEEKEEKKERKKG